jgi:hypothetical protein
MEGDATNGFPGMRLHVVMTNIRSFQFTGGPESRR